MKRYIASLLILVAGCGSGAFDSPAGRELASARTICGEVGFPDAYVDETAALVSGAVLLVESQIADRPFAGDPAVIVNSVFSLLQGACTDRFIDANCFTGHCSEVLAGTFEDPLIIVDVEACCAVCDLDQKLATAVACMECTGAILVGTFDPVNSDAMNLQLQALRDELATAQFETCRN